MAKEPICLHCGDRIAYSTSVFFDDHERWYHPGNVTSDNGGRSCKDAKHTAKPAPICPQCKEPIWDVAFASKLNKCWGCGLAFD